MNKGGEREGKPSLTTMDSKEIFITAVDELSGLLDEMSLYVINMNIDIVGQKLYESYDSLREEIMNGKASAFVDVECFIGKQAWRNTSNIEEEIEVSFLDMSEIKVSDITQYLQNRLKDL